MNLKAPNVVSIGDWNVETVTLLWETQVFVKVFVVLLFGNKTNCGIFCSHFVLYRIMWNFKVEKHSTTRANNNNNNYYRYYFTYTFVCTFFLFFFPITLCINNNRFVFITKWNLTSGHYLSIINIIDIFVLHDQHETRLFNIGRSIILLYTLE